jgi:choline dehydrogenase-like flavoprotein
MFVTDRFDPAAYDCFVVGSGPAGVTLALALARARKRVLVFESGDADAPRSELSNSIGYGHYSGDYWNGHWFRALGGTSALWSGWCVTHRELDLDNPAVGARWPIARSALVPYWKAAAEILDRDPEYIEFERAFAPGFVYRPVPTGPPTRFGVKFRDALQGSGGVDVALGRSVVGFGANARRSHVTAIEYVDHLLGIRRSLPLASGQAAVVAAGGMGNAQLLLQPREDGAVPVGNESGVVGHFLMEHPEFYLAGECVMEAELDKYWPEANKSTGMHAIVADRALSVERGLYGCALQCTRKTGEHDMARFMSSESGRPHFHYDITAHAEMLPSAANRVRVTPERDEWGLHRVAAHCVIDARDFHNVERTLRVFGETLIRSRQGRVRVNNDRIYKQVAGEGHTLGTTRMGVSASSSVVDADCRVHGYDNFFVAGSSVFPSGGYANPTLTIVALALRLADTIAGRG